MIEIDQPCGLDVWMRQEEIVAVQEAQVILMAGLPGSGKSTVGQIIAKHIGAEYLRSDAIRQEKFADSGRLERDSSLYKPKSEEVYAFMRQRMVEIALTGGKAVVDATHLNPHRTIAIEALKTEGLFNRSLIVWVESDPDTIIARQRQRQGDPGTGETWEEGWLRVYNWFLEELAAGRCTYPNSEEGLRIIKVKN